MVLRVKSLLIVGLLNISSERTRTLLGKQIYGNQV